MTPKPSWIAACLCLACLPPLFAEENAGLFFRPWYAALARAGSEDGGLRDERREQNRARLVHRIGIDANYFANKSNLFALRASWQGLHDFHYYNARSQRREDGVRLSEGWLAWCRGTSVSACKSPVLFSGPDWSVSNRRPSQPPSSAFGSAGNLPRQIGSPPLVWSFRLGRSLWAADQSGLFFTGESPLIYAGLRLPLSRGDALSLRAGAAKIERENRGRRGLSPSQRIKARYYMLFGDYKHKELFVGFHYGFYRSPGRAAKPDWILAPSLPEPFSSYQPRWRLPVGQSARADADVHYYGIFPEWEGRDWQLRARLWHNYGRLISVDAAGTRIRSSRKSVQGSLVWGEVAHSLGPQRQAGPCPIEWIRRGGCLQRAPQNRALVLALGGIYATRDRDSADQELNGFGSLRPSPAVLGGGGSIFLTGPPPGIERPAFQNTQPQGPFSDGGRKPYTEPRHFRDNSDPAPPDYSNDGLRMGGLRASYLFAGTSRLRVQIFGNYAALRYGIGREAIFSFSGVWEPLAGAKGPYNLCRPKAGRLRASCQFAPKIGWQIVVTSASYSPAKREVEPYTGTSRHAPTRFYSRVQALLSFRF